MISLIPAIWRRIQNVKCQKHTKVTPVLHYRIISKWLCITQFWMTFVVTQIAHYTGRCYNKVINRIFIISCSWRVTMLYITQFTITRCVFTVRSPFPIHAPLRLCYSFPFIPTALLLSTKEEKLQFGLYFLSLDFSTSELVLFSEACLYFSLVLVMSIIFLFWSSFSKNYFRLV